MKLRTKLGLQIAVGAVVLIAATGAVRSAIVRSELIESARGASRTVAEDVLWQLERRTEQLGARVAAGGAIAWARSHASDPSHASWAALVRRIVRSPDETVVLVDADGDLLEVDGALAGDGVRLAAALRSRGFAGSPRLEELHTGMLVGGEEPLVAASVALTAPEGGTEESEEMSPSLSPRMVLIAPLSKSPLITAQSTLAVHVHSMSGSDLPDDIEEIVRELWRTEGRYAGLTDRGARHVRVASDGLGRPAFVIDAHAYADVRTLVPGSVRENLLWEALVAALAVAIAMRFTSRAVSSPIERLQLQSSRLARTEHGQLSFRTLDKGEFGELAQSIDAMLRKIELDRSRFVRNARIAGMSDVSMGVVHSAGNILNSVNVSTKLLVRELRSIGIDDLKAMVAELEEHAEDLTAYVSDDENGRFLIPFLAAMTNAIADIRARCMFELDSVDRGVTHVVDLIRSQEKYAIGASVVEATDVTEVVEMALQVASMTIEGAESIVIERAFSKLTPVRIDRHRLTSILINIITNSFEALLVGDVAERRLELATYAMDGERFVIEISDTGIGIAPENLDLIFTSAFTTKAGSAGEGLHTTANACRELGIAVGVVSQGEGSGCTFKLRVPYEPPVDCDDSRPDPAGSQAPAPSTETS
ncbi:MAG: ATP-binding protein [Planctomycetota bacterium]